MQHPELAPSELAPDSRSAIGPPAPPARPAWSRRRWFWLLSALTLATLLIQGFHPLAEDGGLYAAGVELTLHRALFPHFTAFVSEHLRFSIFAPLLATLMRLTHLSLEAALLLVDLGSIALTLVAARALLRRAVTGEFARLAGMALLAALWTMPVAATSLLLMDPYVTARSLSTPLSLLAIAFALDPWPFRAASSSPHAWRSFWLCAGSLILAILFHPLMAGYALGLILVLRLQRRSWNLPGIAVLVLLTLALSGTLQALAPAESPAIVAASFSRYYWFLSQWHWYELLGLIGPLLVFVAFLRWLPLREPGKRLCRAALVLGPLSVLIALLFAHESYRTHLVARLQPLRSFLPLYAIMVLLLGAALVEIAARFAKRAHATFVRRLASTLPALLIVLAAIGMYESQLAQFPASNHLELPWRMHDSLNPWTRAFLWCRSHTPLDALFALDAHYIGIPGEDSQTFRAISQRSVLPDFSKDGGEAAITPRLAATWAAGVAAQLHLDRESDALRRAHLQPYGVSWLVLTSSALTELPCPYNNGAVKVCRLVPPL